MFVRTGDDVKDYVQWMERREGGKRGYKTCTKFAKKGRYWAVVSFLHAIQASKFYLKISTSFKNCICM